MQRIRLGQRNFTVQQPIGIGSTWLFTTDIDSEKPLKPVISIAVSGTYLSKKLTLQTAIKAIERHLHSKVVWCSRCNREYAYLDCNKCGQWFCKKCFVEPGSIIRRCQGCFIPKEVFA